MKDTHQPLFTPEQELLLWSIRVDHSKDQRAAEILSAGVDWNYVRENAIQHGIIPLLYKRLKNEMSDLVPSKELEELRTLFISNAVRNLRMTQQLIKVLDLLADAGVEAIPFKGPALAVQAYGDLSMRSFCDLDILIHEKDFNRMYLSLEKAGYPPDYPVNLRTEAKFITYQKKNLPISYQGTHLEIHWRITERFLSVPFNMDRFWNNACSVSLNNRNICTLSPEDMVIVLCVHGTKHLWNNIKWLADLVQLISNNPDLQWQEIHVQAEELGVRRILSLGLYLVHEHGGINYPGDSKQRLIHDVNFKNIVNILETNFFHVQSGKLEVASPVFYLKLRERFTDKVHYFIYTFTDRIIPPNYLDFKVISLPDSLFPVYVIIRPFRLLKDYCQKKDTPLVLKCE
ncbi:MAG: hypothetical protein BWX87_02453 [Bacteroidetes bacterium ADurb.Bin123]|nr:MAG: hypothetical protein BWX87_02453 [Bacteroidetes bacterium ADurb.Bin123]